MDKYEYKVRSEEIKSLIAEGDFIQAAKIADTIDWNRVKSVMMLCTISDLYKINRRYEDSKNLLLLAYERHPGGRLIVYSLCELSIKLGEYVQALEYYKEFVQVAPKDTGCFILQYKLYEAQDVSLEERIAVLEELKKRDYREKWAYELAYLYHRVGLATKCAEECDDVFLWFGEGKYVLKALELKKLHMPLSGEQAQRYEEIMEAQSYQEEENAEPDSLQEETFEEDSESDMDAEADSEDGIWDYFPNKVLAEITEEEPGSEDYEEDYAGENMDTREYLTADNYAGEPEPVEAEMDIQVKTIDISQYNTINLQQELAESMKEILEEPRSSQVLQKQDTDEIRLINSGDFPEIRQAPVAREVYFGDTAEVDIQEAMENTKISIDEVSGQLSFEDQEETKVSALSNTGIIKTFIKPSGYDEMLSQESSGQISLVVSDQEKVEKQITGQLSIEDIMTEWEKMKRENELKRREEIKLRVRKQTDTLFADFDEATKSGLLEKLEKAMVAAVAIEEEKKAVPGVIKIAELGKQAVAGLEEMEGMHPTEEMHSEEEEVLQPEDSIEDILAILEDLEEPEEEKIPEAEPGEEAEHIQPAEQIQQAQEIQQTGQAKQAELAQSQQPEAVSPDPVMEKAPVEDPRDMSEEAGADNPKAADRDMTEGEKEQFGRFVHHRRTRKQITETIDNISMAAYTGNVIITGEEGAGTIELAKELIREVQLTDNNFSGKVAKISGATLNKKDIPSTLGKLDNGAVIIENATKMSSESFIKLTKELEQENTGLIVILEDIKVSMNQFIEKNADLMHAFNLRVDLEALNDQALVAFAKQYAEGLEYSIDELGILALHTRIADMQTSDHEVTIAEVEEIVEEAIYYADRKTPKHFFDILIGKRYDEDDMIILSEKDFMHY